VLGLALYAAGRLKEALPYLEATRQWARDAIELHYFLGLAYLQTGNVDAARRALAVTFNVPPESAAAHLTVAQMLVRLNLDEPAVPELKQALQKDARLPHARYLLGQIALFRGRLDESADWTRGELEVNPADAMAWYQLGDVHVRRAEWQQAIDTLQRSLWLNPFYSGPYILLGRAYMKTGQSATAEGMLRRAIQYDPNNRTAHYLLAQLLQQLGREDEARAEFAVAEKLQGQPGRP
jgi:tetratricopeptide (TPR) repeat protein